MKYYSTTKGSEIIRIIGKRSNVFVVKSGLRNILIDTSVSRVRNKVLKRLQHFCPSGVDLIILTHSHYDHSANAAFLQNLYGVKVLIHKCESELLAGGLMASPAGTTFFTRPLMKFLNKRNPVRLSYEPCMPDIVIDEEFAPFSDVDIKLIHSPGHSPGSICVIIDKEIAIVGDTMFGIFPGSAFPPFADDVTLLYKSWERLLKTNCKIFLPAHGSAVSDKLLQRNLTKREKRQKHV